MGMISEEPKAEGIDFEKEVQGITQFGVLNIMHDDLIEWGRSIAARVEALTIERYDEACRKKFDYPPPLLIERLYSLPEPEEGKK